MKLHIKNILIPACLFLFIAPLSIVAQTPPDLEVFDPQFTPSTTRGFDSAYFYGTSSIDRFPSQMTSYHVREISAVFWNTGTKPIKSVKWEYILFRDAQETELARVYRFHSERKLLPGESRRFRKYGLSLQTSDYKKVRVTRIEYADGTVWQGTKTKK
jgi:hypothetical protein